MVRSSKFGLTSRQMGNGSCLQGSSNDLPVQLPHVLTTGNSCTEAPAGHPIGLKRASKWSAKYHGRSGTISIRAVVLVEVVPRISPDLAPNFFLRDTSMSCIALRLDHRTTSRPEGHGCFDPSHLSHSVLSSCLSMVRCKKQGKPLEE